MCLDTVFAKKTKKRTGYKVFTKGQKTLSCTYRDSTKMRIGKTYVDKNKKPIDSIWKGSYPAGFHCFEYLKDAKEFAEQYNEVVVRVLLDDIAAHGSQHMEYSSDPKNVIVAKKITLQKILFDYSIKKQVLEIPSSCFECPNFVEEHYFCNAMGPMGSFMLPAIAHRGVPTEHCPLLRGKRAKRIKK